LVVPAALHAYARKPTMTFEQKKPGYSMSVAAPELHCMAGSHAEG